MAWRCPGLQRTRTPILCPLVHAPGAEALQVTESGRERSPGAGRKEPCGRPFLLLLCNARFSVPQCPHLLGGGQRDRVGNHSEVGL